MILAHMALIGTSNGVFIETKGNSSIRLVSVRVNIYNRTVPFVANVVNTCTNT
jgi:hypothetical protein